jgi:GNAT superfamily N-acetyltransferase
MIELRACENDADYESWLAIRRAVLPDERSPTLDELRTFIQPGDLHLLAFLHGEVAGGGLANRSDVGGRAHVAPRVLPERRGKGVGTALLTRLAEHAVAQGYGRAGSNVNGADEGSIAFAGKFGFEEQRRDIQQVRVLDGDVPVPRDVDGVEFVSIAERPQLLREAYPLAQQGYEDMPIDGLDISLHTWLTERPRCLRAPLSHSQTTRTSATPVSCSGRASRRRPSTGSPSCVVTGAAAVSPPR